MKREIVVPAVLPPSALAELKQWLGITTAHDDALLVNLLQAALDICEGFTGLMPLKAGCEEIHQAATGWQRLATLPVETITYLETVALDATRTALAVTDYELEIGEDGHGYFRLLRSGSSGGRVAVHFVAGMAPDWDGLPEGLRHGVVRLAAHQHREREASGASPLPPASVAALWRPWRRLRLA